MSVPTRKAELASVDGEYRAVVLDLDRLDDPPLILTGSAAAIWWHIDGHRSESEIVRLTARMFALSPDEIRAEVMAFLADLSERDLIVRT